jgi:hypothetical protein
MAKDTQEASGRNGPVGEPELALRGGAFRSPASSTGGASPKTWWERRSSCPRRLPSSSPGWPCRSTEAIRSPTVSCPSDPCGIAQHIH